jgi:hypothetical protein
VAVITGGLTTLLLSTWDGALRADAEYQVVGRFLTCRVLLQTGLTRFVVVFHSGRIACLINDADPTESWDFALRAPESTWQNFLLPQPPPGFHDIWAAATLGHMTIEGDMWRHRQNHYAFWRALEVLRASAQSPASRQ